MHDDSLHRRIDELVRSDRVVLFMKGRREQPQGEFSAATVEILDAVLDDYTTIDVLDAPELLTGVEAYADWPTVPQLYVDGRFVGGCDLVKQMDNTGDLHELLGLARPDRTPPEIRLSEEAARIVRAALDEAPGQAVHLRIDARWEHRFSLAAAEGHEVVARVDDLDVHLDRASAARAAGLRIDVEETPRGHMLRIDNPNAPPPVQSMTVHELHARRRRAQSMTLVDVRTQGERERARIEPSMRLDDAAIAAIAVLPRDTTLVFYCHHGQRSQMAAEHFRNLGFADVHNLEGGIDAWSRHIDADVPTY